MSSKVVGQREIGHFPTKQYMQLTTRQRDVLQCLLNADAPIVTADIARQLELSSRQVSYSLTGLKSWLLSHDIELRMTPGIGVQLINKVEGRAVVFSDLGEHLKFHVVLMPVQRQTLLALSLLNATEPHILFQLQLQLDVSRNTIAKDLDEVTEWLAKFDLTLERRTNYGCWIEGSEWAKRSAINTLLWEQPTSNEGSLLELSHVRGLVLQFDQRQDQLPIIAQVAKFVKQLRVKQSIDQIAYAEASLGGRYTDDAVLYLGMVLAVQTLRQRNGHLMELTEDQISMVSQFSAWTVAKKVFSINTGRRENGLPDAEIAFLAMHLLSAMRNERWPSDNEADESFSQLIADVINDVVSLYEIEELREDFSLRDGLYAHIYPACMRHRFSLSPVKMRTESLLPDRYEFEHSVAQKISSRIETQLGTTLLPVEVNNIALLLRAAYIRERPVAERHIIVVCPSGMATAQLLVARLKARFPRLGVYTILSVRDLDVDNLAAASLVITTTRLSLNLTNDIAVIQVHPLLMPDDVESITKWMA